MSFNSFLSTTENKRISLRFARNTPINEDMVRLLFMMTIGVNGKSALFAKIRHESCIRSFESTMSTASMVRIVYSKCD